MENNIQIIENSQVRRKDGFYIIANLFDVQPQTAVNYGIIFTALRPCEVLIVSEVHGTKGTDGGAVTLDIEKLTGTTAKGAGTSILSTTFSLKSDINVPIYKQGTSLSTARTMVQGDRLAIKSSGVLADLKDLQVIIYYKMLGRGDYF